MSLSSIDDPLSPRYENLSGFILFVEYLNTDKRKICHIVTNLESNVRNRHVDLS